MPADGRAEESPQQRIQSIEVGAQVLRALQAGRGPMALSGVARNCAMHPAKVHRYLVSLVRAGLASQDARTGQYDLGPAGDAHSRRRRAREAPGQNETRRDRELAAPDDPRDGGVRRARIRPDRGLVLAIGLAMPARLLVDGEADGLADALRSTAGQISAELGYRPA
jgi:DNA-binding IclR family transcriptional regulator